MHSLTYSFRVFIVFLGACAWEDQKVLAVIGNLKSFQFHPKMIVFGNSE